MLAGFFSSDLRFTGNICMHINTGCSQGLLCVWEASFVQDIIIIQQENTGWPRGSWIRRERLLFVHVVSSHLVRVVSGFSPNAAAKPPRLNPNQTVNDLCEVHGDTLQIKPQCIMGSSLTAEGRRWALISRRYLPLKPACLCAQTPQVFGRRWRSLVPRLRAVPSASMFV